MSANIYTWKGLLINFIWRLVIPGFFIWFIPYLIDHKIIDEDRDAWAEPIIVPLMIVLILGTAINFFYLFYYLIRVLFQKFDQGPN